MSRRGWDVYATARSDVALRSLDRLPNVHAIPLDITDRSAIAALPGRLPTALNGVVNNAGGESPILSPTDIGVGR